MSAPARHSLRVWKATLPLPKLEPWDALGQDGYERGFRPRSCVQSRQPKAYQEHDTIVFMRQLDTGCLNTAARRQCHILTAAKMFRFLLHLRRPMRSAWLVCAWLVLLCLQIGRPSCNGNFVLPARNGDESENAPGCLGGWQAGVRFVATCSERGAVRIHVGSGEYTAGPAQRQAAQGLGPQPGPAHQHGPVPAWPVHPPTPCGTRLAGRRLTAHSTSDGPMRLLQGLALPVGLSVRGGRPGALLTALQLHSTVHPFRNNPRAAEAVLRPIGPPTSARQRTAHSAKAGRRSQSTVKASVQAQCRLRGRCEFSVMRKRRRTGTNQTAFGPRPR